jgi:FKBP-type peptidyl-prolyl cis-trans isomerase SlyD
MAIENNMVVGIEYELRDTATSDIIDSNVGGNPLEFITGRNHIIPGLEVELLTMSSGDNKMVTVSPKDGYGEYDETALEEVPAEQFTGIDLKAGMALYAQGEDGSTIQVTVKEILGETVKVDYNHPLAGKELQFDVRVLNVREPSEEESMTGHVAQPEAEGCCGGGGQSSGCGCN